MKNYIPKLSKLSSSIIAFTGIYVGATSMVSAAELYIPEEFTSIQEAINAAVDGDILIVSPGTYNENINFNRKDLTLRSETNASETILRGIGGTVVTIGPNAEIEGFTIENGSASFGSGISVRGSNTRITNNIFEENRQGGGGYGAAIGGNSASPIIDRNLFRNNTCDGQFLSGVISFVNGSSPIISNNILVDNPCRAINITLPTGNTPTVVNNTIVRNNTGIRVDRRIDSSSQIYRNNIIAENNIGFEVDFGNDSYNPIWENNLVFNNAVDYDVVSDQTGLNGNISIDPQFIGSHDFHLISSSPAIDAGQSQTAPTSDFDLNIRPVDGNGDGIAAVDIGAYEFNTTQPFELTQTTDIGFSSHEGSFTYDSTNNVYTLDSGGSNLGGWVDNFHFVYEETQGDIDFRARIVSISEGWASAGIMIRDTLDSGSIFSASVIEHMNSGHYISRFDEYTPNPSISVPELEVGSWVRLHKEGNIITHYISNNGVDWDLVNSETISIGFEGSSYYIGLAGVTVESATSTTIVFNDVTVH